MGSKKHYKNWNIKGIAESVIEEIREDREDGEDRTDEDYEEYLDRVLEYYSQETYWSIYSRDTKDARIVAELVKQHIEEVEAYNS